jgi:AraC-like DNA-binding protein
MKNENRKNSEIPTLFLHQGGISDVEIESLHGCFRFLEANPKYLLPHQLTFYSIVIFIKNCGKHYIDFNEYTYKPGTIFLIAENQIHKYIVDYLSDGYVISFTADFFNNSETDISILNQYSLFNLNFSPVVELSENEQKLIYPILKLFREDHLFYIENNPVLRKEILYTMLKLILLKIEVIKRKQTETITNKQYFNEYYLLKITIEKNFLIHRRIDFYSNLLCLSEKKINSISKLFSGKTVKQLIDQRIILEIKRLLVNTSLSVKEVAFKTGFDDIPNFVNFFKKHTGSNTSEFRDNLNKS